MWLISFKILVHEHTLFNLKGNLLITKFFEDQNQIVLEETFEVIWSNLLVIQTVSLPDIGFSRQWVCAPSSCVRY